MREIAAFFAFVALLLFAVVFGIGRIAQTGAEAYKYNAAQRTSQVQIAETQETIRRQFEAQQRTMQVEIAEFGETQRLLIKHETRRMLAQLQAQMGLTYFVLLIVPVYGVLFVIIVWVMQKRTRETENRLDAFADSLQRFAGRVEQRHDQRAAWHRQMTTEEVKHQRRMQIHFYD